MKDRRLWILMAILGLLAVPSVRGATGAEKYAADGETSDKAKFSLFNPVPDDALRAMDTDRPNVTNTPHTIDAGHVQIETGLFDVAHFRDRSNGGDVTSDMAMLGRINVRLGLLANLEGNVEIDSFDRLKFSDHVTGERLRREGFGDITAGLKLNLWGNEGGNSPWSSGLALQPKVKFPTAQQPLGNGHVEWTVGMPFVINLVEEFHLGLQITLGQERNSLNTGYVAGWQNSISLDRVIFGKFDTYLEFASRVTSESHVQPQQTVDFGVIYALTDNVTLDTGFFFGTNRATPAIEWTAGGSIRF